MDFVPINQTSQYTSALVEIKDAIIALSVSPIKMKRIAIRVPDELVTEIKKRGEMAYDSVKGSLGKNLEEFGSIDDWSTGEEKSVRGKTKPYIQFYLIMKDLESPL